mmetsp:Transcript_81765/g.128735  ORF Transcript_81765/g.128735 Transcript_81765/m.128735 type:complete len:208 (+) Transcript_81765:73-696(+)
MGNRQGHGSVQCETAFPEHTNQVPLGPKMDKELGYGKYKRYAETFGPLPEFLEFVNDLKVVEEQSNQTYDHNLKYYVNPEGNPKPHYSSTWEKMAAYHHGLYVPEMYQPTKTSDEIRSTVNEYTEKVHADAPKDACKYLQIEEFRCLNLYQYETNPAWASKKCMKWYDEMQKCQWDQAKFNSGTTYIEGPQMRRRRPYIFYPDFKYA